MMDITNILIFISVIALFLFEALLEVALLSSVGAFARKIFGPKQKSFKHYYKESAIINSIIGIAVILVLLAFIVGTVKLVAH